MFSQEIRASKSEKLAKIFRPGCQKRKSCVQQTLWGKIILLSWVQFWHSIELSTKEKFDLGRKHNNRSIEAAFAVSRGTFGRKQIFWKIYKFDEKVCTLSKKKSDFSRKIETELSEHLFLCPGKPWRKTSLQGKIIIFFNFFGLWAQEKSDFCLELLAWVPELNSLSPQEKIDQNPIFFEKKLNFSSSMWTFKFKYSFFGFQTSAGLSKVQVTCPLKLVFQRCSFF